MQARAGSFVFISRHTTSSCRITSPATCAPAGFEEFLRPTAAPAARILSPPGRADNPKLDKDHLAALATKYGMRPPELE